MAERPWHRIWPIISALKVLWNSMPDMRFIQLLVFIIDKVKEYEGTDDPFYMEDDNIEGYLYKMIAEVKVPEEEAERA